MSTKIFHQNVCKIANKWLFTHIKTRTWYWFWLSKCNLTILIKWIHLQQYCKTYQPLYKRQKTKNKYLTRVAVDAVLHHLEEAESPFLRVLREDVFTSVSWFNCHEAECWLPFKHVAGVASRHKHFLPHLSERREGLVRDVKSLANKWEEKQTRSSAKHRKQSQ